MAGSASAATAAQVKTFTPRHPSYLVHPHALDDGPDVVSTATAWARPRLRHSPVLICTAPPPAAGTRTTSGSESATRFARVSERPESVMVQIAAELVGAGVRRLLVAGGETSGAVVARLGLSALRVVPTSRPGFREP